MSDLSTPQSRRIAEINRGRALALALNTAIGIACAGVAVAIGWRLLEGAPRWEEQALGQVGLAAFAVFAALQLRPLVRAFLRLDLE